MPETVVVLKALADPMRLQILNLLAERPRGTSELALALPISRQGTAKHLGILRDAGLIDSRSTAGTDGAPAAAVHQVDAARVGATGRALSEIADRWDVQLRLIKERAEGAS